METILMFLGGIFLIATLLFTWCAIRINKGEDKYEK